MSVTIESAVAGFIAHKRAIGRKYVSEEAELALLVRFARSCGAITMTDLTPAVIEAFLASRPRSRPRSFNHLRGVLGCLLDWAAVNELITISPLTVPRRRVTSVRLPFLFSPAQARRLLDAAAALPEARCAPAAGRGQIYRTVFALCYGLGLRGGEACGLRAGDVDARRQLLIVRGGKFGKTRLVPYGPRIGALVAAQLGRRSSLGRVDEHSPLFTFDGRTPLRRPTATKTFHDLVPGLALTVPDGVIAPHLHHLRHSFAVTTLARWYRDGADPAAHLVRLSTFMGHVSPSSTAVYLTITDELKNHASSRFETYAASVWAEALP